jgi:hypothetical protein
VKAEDVVLRGVAVKPSLEPDFVGEEEEMTRQLREEEDFRNTFSILQGLLGLVTTQKDAP